MKNGRISFMCSLLLMVSFSIAFAGQPEYPLAVPEFYPESVVWFPVQDDARLLLRVACPDGTVQERQFGAGETPVFALCGAKGVPTPDGVYTYELIPVLVPHSRTRGEQLPDLHDKQPLPKILQSGNFRVQNGVMVVADEDNEESAEKDVLHYDDVIATGSLCVGFDCINGESFGYCTVKLKENNLQLCFEDTSIGTFPTNDWKFQINDTTSGGASYFTLWDTDAGRRPFTIEAGAPAHSLYVEDYGRVGLGTSIPYVELHIADGDSPTVRLDQDGSSGWSPQKWDICGNETNFFIRDVTNGSKLCFRIQPNTPSNTLCLKNDGNVGFGTWSPQASVHIQATGDRASLLLERTDGATTFFASKTNNANFGSASNHPIRLVVGGAWKMQLNADDSLQMKNNAVCTTAGQWQDASSREYKENIQGLSTQEATTALAALEPVKFTYKSDASDECLGFIAEDVPDLVATSSRKTMSSMDVVAVLTKVVQEQQRLVQEQQRAIEELRRKVAELENRNGEQ